MCVAALPGPPVAQATGVLGHDQVDAVLVDAVVMQLAHPWDVPQAVHDANLCEGCQLQHGRHPSPKERKVHGIDQLRHGRHLSPREGGKGACHWAW